MKTNLTQIAALLVLAASPLLLPAQEAAEDALSEEAASEAPAAADEAVERAQEAPRSAIPGGGFTPTEQLRYDQEVDFPVDI